MRAPLVLLGGCRDGCEVASPGVAALVVPCFASSCSTAAIPASCLATSRDSPVDAGKLGDDDEGVAAADVVGSPPPGVLGDRAADLAGPRALETVRCSSGLSVDAAGPAAALDEDDAAPVAASLVKKLTVFSGLVVRAPPLEGDAAKGLVGPPIPGRRIGARWALSLLLSPPLSPLMLPVCLCDADPGLHEPGVPGCDRPGRALPA